VLDINPTVLNHFDAVRQSRPACVRRCRDWRRGETMTTTARLGELEDRAQTAPPLPANRPPIAPRPPETATQGRPLVFRARR
jgi:hypothetical protein